MESAPSAARAASTTKSAPSRLVNGDTRTCQAAAISRPPDCSRLSRAAGAAEAPEPALLARVYRRHCPRSAPARPSH